MYISVIIPAAGSGKRMNTTEKKQFLKIDQKEIIAYTVEKFNNHPLIDEIIIVTSEDDIEMMKAIIYDKHDLRKVSKIVKGGDLRQYSIQNGLLEMNPCTELVLVHDGARPLIDMDKISEMIVFLQDNPDKGAVLGVPVKNTIKVVSADGKVVNTPDREYLVEVHTPQGFPKKILLDAYLQAKASGFIGTDDSSIIEKCNPNFPIHIITDSYQNIKITTSEDLMLVESYLKL